MELEKETQEFLQSLDKEKIEKINKALEYYDFAQKLGKFVAYLAATLLGLLIFFETMWEKIVHVKKLIF